MNLRSNLRGGIFRGRAARAALFALGVAGPIFAEPSPPLVHAAAAQSRAGEEAYLTGRIPDAVPLLREAGRLYLSAGDLPDAARALVNLALAQRAAGDKAGVAATAARLRELTPAASQQAREQPGPVGEPAEIAASSGWLDALVALDAGDAAAAERLATAGEKLPAGSPWTGRRLNVRAEAALAQKHFADALVLARAGATASAEAHDRAEEARGWRLAGWAQSGLGHWADARAVFLDSLRIEEALGGGARMAGDLAQLAVVSRQLGDAAAAELYERRARLIGSAR